MYLYNSIATNMLAVLNTSTMGGIGAAGAMDFYTAVGDIPTTGILGASSRVYFSAVPISTFSTSADGTGTRVTAVFDVMTTGTAGATATAAYFSIMNTTATNPGATNIVLTGLVGTTGADINFNVVGWDTNDNISITSLTFVQPK